MNSEDEYRQLRILMIHQYVRDMAVLDRALNRGLLAVPLLETSAQHLAGHMHVENGAAGSANLV